MDTACVGQRGHGLMYCWHWLFTSPLQYWSNDLKLLTEGLWLRPLDCFLGKGSEDALWSQAFCQVSYSPMAGLSWRRRGLQDFPQHSSTENMGKQNNGSTFWCLMCHCSSSFQYSVSSAWDITEGEWPQINNSPVWTNGGHVMISMTPWRNCCHLGLKVLDSANLKCISTYIGLVGFDGLGQREGPFSPWQLWVLCPQCSQPLSSREEAFNVEVTTKSQRMRDHSIKP